MRKSFYLLIWSVSSLSFLIISACGGGGGGAGGSASSGITYTGNTAQAAITSANATTLANGAVSSGSMGTMFAANPSISTGNHSSHIFQTVMALEKAVEGVDLSSARYEAISGASMTRSGTTTGSCGGSGSFSINYDDVSGAFSGSMSFHSYCSSNTILSGNAIFSGIIDVVTKDFKTFSLTFTELTGTTGGVPLTTKGNITFVSQSPSYIITLDWLLRNDQTQKVYWIKNSSMTMTKASGYADFTITGTYYDHDHGYVNISTQAAFRLYAGYNHPSQGILIIDGRTGIAGGSTKARLTAITSSTYRVEADTNGDGSYDWNSGTMNW